MPASSKNHSNAAAQTSGSATMTTGTGAMIPGVLGGILPTLCSEVVVATMEQLVTSVTRAVQQDLILIRAVPDNVLQEQFTARLNTLQASDLLTDDEAATLQGIVAGTHATESFPPLFAPDGSPSLCGYMALAMRTSAQPTTHGVSPGGVITVGLSTLGGATLGYALGGPVGGTVGGVLGAVIAAASVS